jgi:zinc transport system substrate-binding protein
VRSSLLILTLWLVASSPGWSDEASAGLKVFASVLPVQTFVEQVGGERVQTEVMVLPGHSPATYDPSPKQVAALAEADLYVRVGVPFEQAWMKRIQAANPKMPILDLRDGLPLRALEAHTHAENQGPESEQDRGPEQVVQPKQEQTKRHEHRHDRAAQDSASATDEMDPHIWTSPLLARQMAVAIRDQLSALDPDGSALYQRNQQRFDAELLALHQRLTEQLDQLDNRAFLVYHPAWGYFADTYRLEQIPIERAGKEPGPRRLSALIEQARAAGTRAIFVQPEFDQRVAQQIARSIQGRVEPATPLAADYADNLQRFADILVDANGSNGNGNGTNASAQTSKTP